MKGPRAGRLAIFRPSPARGFDVLMFGALLATCVLVSRAYVSQERWIYYWDQAVHQDVAQGTAQAFAESWPAGWRYVMRSFKEDYNALFALPLVPLLRWLGDSRLGFITALALASLLPFALSLGALATRLVRGPRRVVFWSGAWLALLVPMTWVPTLRGFPDALPASLVVVALALNLGGAGGTRGARAALSGALLAVAVILRRHFGYTALAVFEAVALYGIARLALALFRKDGTWGAVARRTATWLTVSGAAAAAVLLTLGYSFVQRVATTDFGALYRAYELPVPFVLSWLLRPYGWAALLIAGVGLLSGLLIEDGYRGRLSFFVLFAAASSLQWLAVVRQVGEQYTLQFTAVVVVGLLASGRLIWRWSGRLGRSVAAALACIWLVGNAVLGLSTTKVGQYALWRPLFAAQWEPLRRYDYDSVIDLVEFMDESGPRNARVYVAASSLVINPDLVRHAGRLALGSAPDGPEVMKTPQIDTRDRYPVGALMGADLVVVAEPAQLHLPPDEQGTVRMVHDVFAQGVALARDFTRLPPAFPLIEGVTAHVFKRTRPTSLDTALETLRIAQEYTPNRPGTETGWVRMGSPFPAWLEWMPDGSSTWVAHPVPRGYQQATTLYGLDAARGPARVAGALRFVDQRCAGATLLFSALDTGRQRRPLAELRRRPGDDSAFAMDLDTRHSEHLLLELVSYAPGASIDYCLLKVSLVPAASE